MATCNMKHIAAIMDGNGRYAQKYGLSGLEGYGKGLEAAQTMVKFCKKNKIPFITLYVFSYENWQRDESTVNMLMNLPSLTKKMHSHMEPRRILTTTSANCSLPSRKILLILFHWS